MTNVEALRRDIRVLRGRIEACNAYLAYWGGGCKVAAVLAKAKTDLKYKEHQLETIKETKK